MSYTSDVCTGGTASSTRWYSTSYDYNKAFDNSDSTYWDGYRFEAGDWIKYDLGSGVTKVAAQYTIQIASTVYPTSWKFQGSNDDTNWTDIDTQTGQTFTSGEKRTYNSFSNSTAYRYYRWLLNAINTGNEPSIAELEIMELVEDITGSTSDSANVSDSFDSLIDGSAESATANDVFEAGYCQSPEISDSVAASDNFEALIFIPTIDSFVDVGDDITAGFLCESDISENATVSDNFTIERVILKSLSETLELSDLCAKILGCTISDTIFIYDEMKYGWGVTAESSLDLADTIETILGIIVDEWLTLTDSQTNNWNGQEIVNEAITLWDIAQGVKIYADNLADTVDFVDTSTYALSIAILEYLGFTDLANAMRTTAASVSESMGIADSPAWAFPLSVESALDLVDASTVITTFLNSVQSDLGLADVSSLIARVSDTVTESIAFVDTVSSKGILYNLIYDTLALNVSIELNGDIWECYVLNTPKFLPVMYSGFDFNSYCIFENRAFGANSAGIYELTGDTDAGAKIHTGAILSKTNFNSANQKKFRRGYLDVSGTAVKMILETENGQRQAYNIDAQGKLIASSELKSKKWVLSVAEFESLSSIKLIPIILTK